MQEAAQPDGVQRLLPPEHCVLQDPHVAELDRSASQPSDALPLQVGPSRFAGRYCAGLPGARGPRVQARTHGWQLLAAPRL